MEEDGNKYEEEEMDSQFASDDYLLELHRQLQEMKNQRKQAEKDALLMDGRVKCLRGEEERTLKKIEVTRKKTQEKILSLQQQEEENRRKREYEERKKRELQELKERNRQMLEQKKLEQALRKEEKMRDLQEEARNHKEQRKYNEEIIKNNKLEDQTNCQTKANYIKSQQAIAEEKRKAYELEKKYQLRCEIERKIMEEEEKKEKAELKKKELEEEEIEIMKRLKTTTQTHQMRKSYILFNALI